MELVLSLYLLTLLLFYSFNNIISMCLLLVLNSLLAISYITLLSGFNWYSLLMYLVYIGGVYVLLIFVSFHTPNILFFSSNSIPAVFFLFFFGWEIASSFYTPCLSLPDYTYNMCSEAEGSFYLFLGLFLAVIFGVISFISSSKESFIR